MKVGKMNLLKCYFLLLLSLKMNDSAYNIFGRLNSQQKKLIYKIRTRMIETPDCYGRNEICQLCNLTRDEMSHVIDCVVIKLACPLVYQSDNVRVEDAYEGTNMEKIKHLAVVYTKAWRTRQQLLSQ